MYVCTIVYNIILEDVRHTICSYNKVDIQLSYEKTINTIVCHMRQYGFSRRIRVVSLNLIYLHFKHSCVEQKMIIEMNQ